MIEESNQVFYKVLLRYNVFKAQWFCDNLQSYTNYESLLIEGWGGDLGDGQKMR